MCIYLVDQQHLHYDSAEHIIPAGLGGMQKLPFDFVSREFNNVSSKQEMAFLRSSILAIPRQILGPGKRGSLSPGKATKSVVNVFSRQRSGNDLTLGYIQAAVPVEIPTVRWDALSDEFTVNIAKASTNAEVAVFKRMLAAFDESKVRLIRSHKLDSTTFLLGVNSDLEKNIDFYIASKAGDMQPFTSAILAELAALIVDRSTFTGADRHHIRTHQTFIMGDDYTKCCAKIAFNALAHLKGKDLVLQECFNPLRNWIVNGGDKGFATFEPGFNANLNYLFPPDSHHVLISKVRESLFADVCFYNHFHNRVLLTDHFLGDFQLEGFVCDWKFRKEYDIHTYLAQQLLKGRTGVA
jgi:hypothetical protein